MRRISTLVSNNQRFIPLAATAVLAFVAYGIGAILYPGMQDPQVFINIFRSNAYLLISAIGSTFVILTGGIDLSVGGVVALTTVAGAALLEEGWNAWVVILLMLAMGTTLGAIMGSFIAYLKVQPFIATLAGMWFARGMCFFISDDAIATDNRIYRILGGTKILIPGLADPITQRGDFVSIFVIISFIVLLAAMYLAHLRPFGRRVYAIGGHEGRNEQSARLMGLPVDTTKVLVYTLNGFCSSLAGIALGVYLLSGHGFYVQGFELDVIAAVVIGGTMLSGGEGYVFGTLFGVLVLGITQTLIQFNGTLSSWWTKIVIAALLLIFIGVQSVLASRRGRRRRSEKADTQVLAAERKRRLLLYGGSGAAIVIVLIVILISGVLNPAGNGSAADTPTPRTAACELKPFRQDEAALLVQDGAVVVYERNGGPKCIDELYAIYPEGRISGDDGVTQIEEQVPPADVENLLAGIDGYGWFTDEMYNTWHTPCGQCYGYYLTVSYDGREKTVKGVDGGTDAPADYWQVISLVKGMVPRFDVAP
jgi:ribose/xylose/arabinose/galactoside ABC-type transport system permease subunit